MKVDSKSIVIAAITLALTVAIAPIPFVFMLPLLFTCTTRGIRMSLFMGLAFGLTSIFYSVMMGGSVVAVAFVSAPWIAILPRILVAFCAFGAFRLSKRVIKGKSKAAFVAPYVISAVTGSLTNTVTVVGLLVLFLPQTALGDVTVLIAAPTMLLSGIIEVLAYAVLVPAVSISVNRAMRRVGGVYGNDAAQTAEVRRGSAQAVEMSDDSAL